MPLHEHMVAMDPPNHTRARSLLSRLLTPNRLKANQDFLWELADRQLDDVRRRRTLRVSHRVLKAVLAAGNRGPLGVPREDHGEFVDALANPAPDGQHRGRSRRRSTRWSSSTRSSARTSRTVAPEPRDDVLSELASATYPDGSLPAVTDVVRTATFLFGAGQETTAKLLGAALRILCDRPELAADAARRPEPRSRLHRGDPATGEPGEDRVPAGAPKSTDAGRRRHSGRHGRDDLARGGEPRPRPLRLPARVPAGPQERPRAGGLRPRRAFLSRCTAGPRRRTRVAWSESWPEWRISPSTKTSTDRRTTAGTPTSRRSSSVA